jgi:tetratricopeptide (TPR) repeat protein
MGGARAWLGALCLALALGAGTAPARAQDTDEPAASTPAGEAWRAWMDERPVTARRLAEEALAANPDDLRARVALAGALMDTGELAAARYHLERVDASFRAWGNGDDKAQWLPHAWALKLLADVCGAMDDREAQLAWSDAHDELYSPKIVGSRAWALMKLQRYDAAMSIVGQQLEEDDPGSTSMALTSACAIQSEKGRREAAWDACREALQHDELEGFDLAVSAHNAYGAALFAHRWDQVERIARQGLQSSGEDVSNPWQVLAELYLLEGRGPDAIDAVVNMQRWRLRQRPSLRDQTRASLDVTVASALWVAGRPERALALLDRALEQPDRLGYSSGAEDQEEAATRLLRLGVRRAVFEREREQAASGPWLGRVWVTLRSWWPDVDAQADAAVVRGVLTDRKRLRELWRPYLYGGLGTALPWWLGEVVDVLGVGVASSSLGHARALDDGDPAWEAWFSAFDLEIAWRAGDLQGALAHATRAWAELPEQEGLLRARVAALAADSAWRRGDAAVALGWYERAMRLDPGVLRRLGLALPATVEGSGPAADALRRSPRLTSSPGFRVVVSGPRACLLAPSGDQLGCATAAADAGPAGAADAFHLEVMSLAANLGRFSMDSLDGTTAARRDASAAELERVLDGVEAPGR